MLKPEASRAARALLGWSLMDLVAASGVAFGTLSRFESGRSCLRATTATKIEAAFEAAGVELILAADRTGAVLLLARRREAPPDE